NVVDESVLRLMQSRDSKRDQPRYDVYTVGMLEATLWGGSGRLSSVPADMSGDLSQSGWISEIITGFQVGNQYYGLPFYGESSITYFRKDVFSRYNLTVPEQPTWTGLEQLLNELTTRSGGAHGRICLRGKPGWGENMALVSTLVNSFGGRWYDTEWRSTIDSPQWHSAINFYLRLQHQYGLPEAWLNGYTENLAAFLRGDCDVWVDSTAAGGALAAHPDYLKIDYRQAPHEITDTGANWLWAWGFSVPEQSPVKAAAWEFVEWATSETYQQLVADDYGIQYVPPGTRVALYDNADYRQYAAFSDATITAIQSTDFNQSSVQPVPYRGVQFVQTAEFQQVGNHLGGLLAHLLEQYDPNELDTVAPTLQAANDFANAAHRIARYLDKRDIDAYE
ncbi:MAG: extracellular solute-binding protein, partial [Saccharospirillum sp.]